MAKKKKVMEVQGAEITLLRENDSDYISLTDMAKNFEGDPRDHLRNWLRNGSTVEFLGVWEKVHNRSFNVVEFHHIKSQLTQNTFLMSVAKWVARTQAVGIQAKSGRYGGTYAHADIAIQFATWLSPEFYVYLVKEFQRLKQKEAEQNQEVLEWNVKRTLAKVNYHIHTNAIRENLIPLKIKNLPKAQTVIYSNEADILNMALFGLTAKEWQSMNTDKKGNLRDYASPEQLLVMANLESHNAEFIKEGVNREDRLMKLNEIAIYQMEILTTTTIDLGDRLLDT